MHRVTVDSLITLKVVDDPVLRQFSAQLLHTKTKSGGPYRGSFTTASGRELAAVATNLGWI